MRKLGYCAKISCTKICCGKHLKPRIAATKVQLIFAQALVVLIVLVFASCTSAPVSVEEPAQEQQTPQAVVEEDTPKAAPAPGGIIRIDSTNPKTFNPVINTDLSVDRLLRLVFEPLIAMDESLRPFPAIASAWEFSPDGLTLTLTVREDAVWEDGTHITSNDVTYTLDTINAAPDTSLYKKCLMNIAGYTATDNKTVIINYSGPFGGALYNLTFPVIPRHHFQADTAQIKLPLGSGLYKVAEFNTMRNITLVRSENCYRGRAVTDGIEAVIMRDVDTPLYSFEQGMIDLTSTKNIDWKKICTTRQSTITRYPSLSYEFIAMNYKNPVLNNVNIRKAIACILPRDTIIDKFYNGNMFKTDTPLNPKSWLYEPEIETYEYDAEKAREYINLSEITALGDISVMTNSDNEERVQTAQLLQQELTNIGFNVNLELIDFETYTSRLLSGNFDIAAAGFDMSLAPDFSPFFSTTGALNFVSLNDDLMTAYLAQADSAIFDSAQQAAFSNMQKQFAQQLPFISIGYSATVTIAGDNIYEEVKPVINNPFGNISELLIEH